MPRTPHQDLYYDPPGTVHYNIKYMSGALLNRSTARAFPDIRPGDIDWVWIVEENRYASPNEIHQLCSQPGKIPPKRAI